MERVRTTRWLTWARRCTSSSLLSNCRCVRSFDRSHRAGRRIRMLRASRNMVMGSCVPDRVWIFGVDCGMAYQWLCRRSK